MKTQELKDALRLINKVLSNSKLGPDQGDRLIRARRELTVVARSGKLESERLFRAIEIITNVLVEIVEDESTPRSE